MAENPRVIPPVELRVAEKHANRVLSRFDLEAVAPEEQDRLRVFGSVFVAASRSGLSREHSLEVAAGLSKDGHTPIGCDATSFEELLEAVSSRPEDAGGLLAGVYARLQHSQNPPGRVVVGTQSYLRAAPEEPFLVGLDAQREELRWSVEQLFLYDPSTGENEERGAMHPGILLYGPPGTGKSSLCRDVFAYGRMLAAEKAVPFSTAVFTAADHSKWVGEGAKAVRRKWDAVRDSSGVGVFVLDDLDMVFASRDDATATHGGLQVTAELMQCLSGVTDTYAGNTLVIGTTNRPDLLDDAVTRRFTMHLDVPGYSSLDQYKKYFSRRAPWMDDQEVQERAAYGLQEKLQPAALDRLCRHLDRQRRGRPSERPGYWVS